MLENGIVLLLRHCRLILSVSAGPCLYSGVPGSAVEHVIPCPLDCTLCCLQSRGMAEAPVPSSLSSLFHLPDWGTLAAPLLRPTHSTGAGMTVRSKPYRTSDNGSVECITMSGQSGQPEDWCKSLCPIIRKWWCISSWGKQKMNVVLQSKLFELGAAPFLLLIVPFPVTYLRCDASR